jgi:folate-dependent phosphoribosylglycinamide formyltransferase PurN
MYKLGWFSTGRGQGSRNLLTAMLKAIKSDEVKARIEFVFCSREAGEAEGSDQFIKMVKDYGIPLVTFSYQKFKSSRGSPKANPEDLPDWRLDYDREVMARLGGFHPDLSVLAGYMLVVGREMCARYRMLNLHPAAPGGPVGTWQEVIWQLIEQKAAQSGLMMHLVVPELDRGPVVTYATFPIRSKDFDPLWVEVKGLSVKQIRESLGEDNRLFKEIRRRGAQRELPLVVATVKAFSEGKVRITPQGQVVDDKDRVIKGYDLTGEIEGEVKER